MANHSREKVLNGVKESWMRFWKSYQNPEKNESGETAELLAQAIGSLKNTDANEYLLVVPFAEAMGVRLTREDKE